MKPAIFGGVFAVVTGLLLVNLQGAGLQGADDAKPKYTIKEVMKFHKQKLHEKFIKGTATKQEKEKLLEGYESMLKIKPPKGDAKDWKDKSEALVKAVKDNDTKALEKAVNCKACHDAHK